MDLQRLTIGEMAQMHGVSAKTLRIYQTHGLLTPETVDEKTGYRYYSLRQSVQLDMIQQMKAMGFSLSDIQAILDERDIAKLGRCLEEHITLLSQELARFQLAKIEAEELLRFCTLYQCKPKCGEFLLEHQEKRAICRFPVSNFLLDGGAEEVLAIWDLCLRNIKRLFMERGIPLSLFHNVGCTIPRPSLIDGCLQVTDAFIFLSQPTAGYFPGTETIAAGDYLCIYCDGMFAPDGTYMEAQCLRGLLAEIDRRGYTIAGEYLGEVLCETPAFLYDGRDMMLKLQIPVRLPSARK